MSASCARIYKEQGKLASNNCGFRALPNTLCFVPGHDHRQSFYTDSYALQYKIEKGRQGTYKRYHISGKRLLQN